MDYVLESLPKDIHERFKGSRDAWNAFSWALNEGWIQDYKHLFSERLRRDVGTPEAVERMLAPVTDFHQVSQMYKIVAIVSTSLSLEHREAVSDSYENIFSREQERAKELLSTKDLVSQGCLIFPERCEEIPFFELRNLLIEGYLLGNNFLGTMRVRKNGKMHSNGVVPDQHGKNQLEGELRRYWGKRIGMEPSEIHINDSVLTTYCDENGLKEKAQERFSERLRE